MKIILKKTASIFLSLILALFFSACNGDGAGQHGRANVTGQRQGVTAPRNLVHLAKGNTESVISGSGAGSFVHSISRLTPKTVGRPGSDDEDYVASVAVMNAEAGGGATAAKVVSIDTDTGDFGKNAVKTSQTKNSRPEQRIEVKTDSNGRPVIMATIRRYRSLPSASEVASSAGGGADNKASASGATGPAAGKEWEAWLRVQSGVSRNTLYFGEKKDATDGLDGLYDVPAMLAGDLRACFVHKSGKKLWRDVRAVAPGVQVWRLSIKTEGAGKEVLLGWDPSIIPSGPVFKLVNTHTGEAVDMRVDSRINYVSQGEEIFEIEKIKGD